MILFKKGDRKTICFTENADFITLNIYSKSIIIIKSDNFYGEDFKYQEKDFNIDLNIDDFEKIQKITMDHFQVETVRKNVLKFNDIEIKGVFNYSTYVNDITTDDAEVEEENEYCDCCPYCCNC